MKKKIVPRICLGEGAEYEGYVVMRMPDFDERIDLSERCKVVKDEVEGEDETVIEAKPSTKSDRITLIRNVARLLPEYIVELKITRLSDGFVFDSFDVLKFDTDMAAVISELAGHLVGKHQIQPKDLEL